MFHRLPVDNIICVIRISSQKIIPISTYIPAWGFPAPARYFVIKPKAIIDITGNKRISMSISRDLRVKKYSCSSIAEILRSDMFSSRDLQEKILQCWFLYFNVCYPNTCITHLKNCFGNFFFLNSYMHRIFIDKCVYILVLL